jgi:hypothetical protein
MNRADLRTRVRTLTNIFSTALLSDSQINDVLADVHAEVCSSREWPFLQAQSMIFTEATTAAYELPGAVREVLLVTSLDPHRTLIAASPLDMDRLADPSGEGLPTHYTVIGSTLRLYPRPLGVEALKVRYTTTATALSNDGHSPPFLDEFHPLYAYLAAAKLLAERGGGQQKISMFVGLAEQYQDRMRRHYITSRNRAQVSVGRRRWR